MPTHGLKTHPRYPDIPTDLSALTVRELHARADDLQHEADRINHTLMGWPRNEKFEPEDPTKYGSAIFALRKKRQAIQMFRREAGLRRDESQSKLDIAVKALNDIAMQSTSPAVQAIVISSLGQITP